MNTTDTLAEEPKLAICNLCESEAGQLSGTVVQRGRSIALTKYTCSHCDVDFMIDSEPLDVIAKCLKGADRGLLDQDNFVILTSYANGSLATVSYMSCGDTAMSRERVEVFGGGKSGVMEDFSYLCLSSRGKSEKRRSRLLPDRGFAEEVEQMFKAIADGLGPPTPFRDQITSTRITLQASALLSQ